MKTFCFVDASTMGRQPYSISNSRYSDWLVLTHIRSRRRQRRFSIPVKHSEYL